MKIAMVGLRAPGISGGIEQVVSELGGRLVQRGHSVTAYCRSRYNIHGPTFRGMDLIDLPSAPTRHLEAITHTALAMPRAVASDADVVHIHAVGPALLSFLPRLARRPTVVTVHGLDWRRDKWALPAKAALRLGGWTARRVAHAVIAVSREVEHALDAPKVVHVPNGVTPIPYAPLSEAEVDGIEAGYFLFLGRIVPEKAIEVLVDAHRAADDGSTLVITGGAGYSGTYLRRLKARSGPRVRFTGERFGRAKAALVHHARAVLFPSRLEGLPLGMLEAMGAGRPVIASNIPAHAEICTSTETLQPVDDVSAWTRAMADFDDESAMSRAAEAQKSILHRFAWDRVVDDTVRVYEAALATAGRPTVDSRC